MSEIVTVSEPSIPLLDAKVNSTISGRQVRHIDYNQFRDGDGIKYSATILFESDKDRKLLLEG